MTEAQHTPRSWAVGYSLKECAVYMKPFSDGWAVSDQIAKFARTPEGEAYARLIAAAPDLAQSVRDLLRLHEAHHNHPIHAAARAIIAAVDAA
jgi:hypothetical protein